MPLTVLLLFLLLAAGAVAQNGELRRPGLVVRVAAGDREAARPFLRCWPEVRARVRELTGAPLEEDVVLHLLPDAEALGEATGRMLGQRPPDWVAGLAVPERRVMLVRLDLMGPRARRVRGLLLHELSHVAVGEIAARPEAHPIPRWFDEGLAQYAEGRSFVWQAPNLQAAAFFGRLLPFGELEQAFPRGEGASALAYTQAWDFVTHLARVAPGDTPLRRMLELMGRGHTVDQAVLLVTGLRLRAQERLWRSRLAADPGWILGAVIPLGLGLVILVAAVVGTVRARRRRRRLHALWEAEEGREDRGDQEAATSSR